jgi:hypothetical protein
MWVIYMCLDGRRVEKEIHDSARSGSFLLLGELVWRRWMPLVKQMTSLAGVCCSLPGSAPNLLLRTHDATLILLAGFVFRDSMVLRELCDGTYGARPAKLFRVGVVESPGAVQLEG